MRRLGLLIVPLVLGLTTPAFARHDDDHGHRGGRNHHSYEDRHGDWDHDDWDHDERGQGWYDNDRGDWDRAPVVRRSGLQVVIIARPERDYIRSYYRRNPCDYDRGFRWRPAVGVRVPYGVPCRPVPYGLARGLPYYPGYEHYVVGRDIVLVALATGIIVDVFFDAI